MKFILVYLRLYWRCLVDAVLGLWKNPWTLLLPVGISFAILLLGAGLGRAGLVGGFLLGIAITFLSSFYLYFLGGVVAKQSVGLKDLKTAFLAYFWSVMNVGFVLWIANFGLDFAIGQNPNANAFRAAIALLAAVLLNVAPEVIYLKGSVGGIETIQRSIKFLQENWIEWFVPNGLFIAAIWFYPQLGVSTAFGFSPRALFIGSGLLGGIVLHIMMVFRGQLFQELDGSTHRQRMFRFGRTG
jgi:hypothetical protein